MALSQPFAAGETLTAAKLNDNVGWWAYKAATQSVSSSTTLVNDSHLFWSGIPANTVYALEGYVLIGGAHAVAGDIKADFTVPSGASFLWTSFSTNVASLTDHNVVAQGATVVRSYGTNDGTTMSLEPKGYLAVAGTGGTLQFRWAQNTSNATATQVLVGSWMKITRIQ